MHLCVPFRVDERGVRWREVTFAEALESLPGDDFYFLG
jgi:hypothetical protein